MVVDSKTGLYKEVPKDSRVYVNFNSYSTPDIFSIVEPENGFYMIELRTSKRFRRITILVRVWTDDEVGMKYRLSVDRVNLSH